jgi:hypothetical protein
MVGGHTIDPEENENVFQFEISDERGVDEIKAALGGKGYQAVFKDWTRL